MKQITEYLLCIAAGCVLLSCEYRQSVNNNERLMEQAGTIVEDQPDSALILLDSVNTDILNDADNFKFILLEIQAMDKSGMDISSNTAIFQAKDFFVKQTDYDHAALASYYCGKVYVSRIAYIVAMDFYTEALKYANEVHNEQLAGLIQNNIGNLYYKQEQYDDALCWFRSTNQSLSRVKNVANIYEREAYTLLSMGNVYLLTKRTDSALIVYNDALVKAKTHDDKPMQEEIMQNISVVYCETGNYAKAKSILQKATALIDTKDKRSQLHLNFAQICLKMNQLDSAHFYLEKVLTQVENEKDVATLASIYQLSSTIEEKRENYTAALASSKKYTEYLEQIFNVQVKESLIEIQKKYDFEKIQNEKNKLIIYKWGFWIGIGIGIIFLLIVSNITININRKKIKIQNILLTTELKIKAMEKMADDVESHIEDVEQMTMDNNEPDNGGNYRDIAIERYQRAFRRLLLQHFQVTKKCKKINDEVKKAKSPENIVEFVDNITYGETGKIDYETLQKIMPEITKIIDTKFPELTEKEKCTCCLLAFGCDSLEIATCLDASPNAIYNRTSKIKTKTKFKFENHSDLKVFLAQNLWEG